MTIEDDYWKYAYCRDVRKRDELVNSINDNGYKEQLLQNNSTH